MKVRIRICRLAYNGAEHCSAVFRVLGIAEVQYSSLIFITGTCGRSQKSRIELVLRQKLHTLRTGISCFQEPVVRKLALNLKAPLLRVWRRKTGVVDAF